MNRIMLFEGWNYARSSQWPQKKHSRGVKVIRVLDPEEYQDDHQEAYELMSNYIDDEADINRALKNYHFAEILRPDGLQELVIFDDYEVEEPREGLGYLKGETGDEKYEFSVPANFSGSPYAGWDIEEILWGDLDW